MSAEITAYDTEYLNLMLTPDEYERVGDVVNMLKMADLVNYKTAQAAFPKLVDAVKLVLAIEAHPEDNVEVVKLSSKARAQLHAALKAAGQEDH